MSTLQLNQLTKVYPNGDVAVAGLDLTIEDGELFVLVGPSGCGKTSVLRMVAGLEETTSGEILIDGVPAAGVRTKDRDLAMVFQHGALYPHMTVAENIGFSLRMSGIGRAETDRRVREIAALLGLSDFLDWKPGKLSGGQQQRVAMGRAIIRDPQLFLMDEPMSNLDAKLRTQARADVMRIQRRLGTTTLFVTHDQVEAMALGDRVGVMREGRIVQCGRPAEIYDHPVNLFVAQFVGSPPMSVVVGRVVATAGELALQVGSTLIPLGRAAAARNAPLTAMVGSEVAVGLRPESLQHDDAGDIVASVEETESLGSDQLVHASIDAHPVTQTPTGIRIGDERGSITAFVPPHLELSRFRPLRLRVDPTRLHLFDLATGATIR